MISNIPLLFSVGRNLSPCTINSQKEPYTRPRELQMEPMRNMDMESVFKEAKIETAKTEQGKRDQGLLQ